LIPKLLSGKEVGVCRYYTVEYAAAWWNMYEWDAEKNWNSVTKILWPL